jgi:hypothetical protein
VQDSQNDCVSEWDDTAFKVHGRVITAITLRGGLLVTMRMSMMGMRRGMMVMISVVPWRQANVFDGDATQLSGKIRLGEVASRKKCEAILGTEHFASQSNV